MNMAWIESHQSLGTHRKLLALCQALHIDDTRAVGMLHYLWWWALDNAPDGDITGVSDKTLAVASHWHGTPTLWEQTLRQVGLVDGGIEERRILHNWQDYTGKLVSARERNRERQQSFRERQRNANVTVTSPLRNGATQPNPTQPNSNNPSAVPPVTAATNSSPDKKTEVKPLENTGATDSPLIAAASPSSRTRATTEAEFLEYVEGLKVEFPDLDYEVEFRKFNLWWSEDGRKLKRPKSGWYNWLIKARQISAESDAREALGNQARGASARGNERLKGGQHGVDKGHSRELPKTYTKPEDFRHRTNRAGG